ncbi:heterokaryon incompatibility protein-domain-containing protein, partial [Massariosphaeria phaeospora]
EDGQASKNWDRPWERANGKAYNRPKWFPPLDEKLELKLTYDSMYNYLRVDSVRGWRFAWDIPWGVYTTEDDPASQLVTARAVLQDLQSPETFAVARQWLTECLENHADCPAHTVVSLPTRLVRVSKLGEPESARLCHTPGQTGHYCALSYCWGADQPFSTTEKSYEAYLEALPYNDLPRTIRDALHVTRSLGMQYIWIDSLCIIQKHPEDVPRELAKMLSIYVNAQFTISAAGATTCNEGFLARPDRHEDSHNGPFFLALRADEDTMGSPLNERAWTLQEALLTPRLLIFTALNMVWRCQTKYEPDFCESLATYTWRHEERRPMTPTDAVWQRFRSMVKVYSKRKLTEQSDKLPAISALAEIFSSHIQSDYLAGLRRRYLIHDLMWWVPHDAEEDPQESEPETEISKVPSWSWPSINRSITFNGWDSTCVMADIVDCSVTLVSDRAPFGGVNSGKLIIRGYLKDISLSKKRGFIGDDGITMRGDATLDGRKRERGQKDQFWCFALGKLEGSLLLQQAIIVIKSEAIPGCYRRVGYFSVDSTVSPGWWEQGEKVTITIV